jgi:hypothetical protein
LLARIFRLDLAGDVICCSASIVLDHSTAVPKVHPAPPLAA